MRLKFFAIPALDPEGAEAALNSFLAQNKITSIDRGLVSDRASSFWAVCVTYVEGAAPTKSAPPAAKKSRVDYREVLPAEDFEVFADLRRLRKELAERDGVPLYNVFTNEQLAAMVQQKIRNLQDLGRLPGVGPAKVSKYGQAFLERLAAVQNPKQEAHHAPDGDPSG